MEGREGKCKREQEGNGREIKGERDKQGVKVCEIHGDPWIDRKEEERERRERE